MDLNKLPKDLLIKLISEINNVSNMSIEELKKKKEEVEKELYLKLIKKAFLDRKFNHYCLSIINFEKINLLKNIIVDGKNIEIYIKDEIYSCVKKSSDSYPYYYYRGNLLEILPESIINDIFIFYTRNNVPYWIDY
jgi:hypothetical protein